MNQKKKQNSIEKSLNHTKPHVNTSHGSHPTDQVDRPRDSSTKASSSSVSKTVVGLPMAENMVGGIDEIDALFHAKKEFKAQRKEEEQNRHKDIVSGTTHPNAIHNNNKNKKKRAAGGSDHTFSPVVGKKVKNVAMSYSRDDLTQLKTNEWANDGMGGVFNADGWTGRTESGFKIYKAHLLNKKGAGTTKDCPFDCDCCYM